MAKVVSDDVWHGGRGRNEWDVWLEGQTWQFEQSELSVTLNSFRTMAYEAAKRRGLKVTVGIVGDSLILKVTGPRKGKVTV